MRRAVYTEIVLLGAQDDLRRALKDRGACSRRYDSISAPQKTKNHRRNCALTEGRVFATLRRI